MPVEWQEIIDNILFDPHNNPMRVSPHFADEETESEIYSKLFCQ